MKQFLPVLKKSALFSDLDGQEILSLLDCLGATVKSFEKGRLILRRGEQTNQMGLLLSGSALILQDDVWGRRNIMTKIKPSQTFAEPFAVLENTALNVSVEANEKSEVLFLSVNRLLHSCSNRCPFHGAAVKNLICVLSEKVFLFNNKITHMSKRTTKEKLLSFLSFEATKNGSLSFEIDFNRQQLADYLCVERCAMSVELSKLQKQGLVKVKKNRFELNPKIDLIED